MTGLTHGGGLIAAQRAYPDAPTPWIDLSTGINPIAYPVGEIVPHVWRRLPERDDTAALEAVAAHAYRAPSQNCVVAAAGVQSLIQLLPLVFPAQRVAVIGPTYEEHALRWQTAGASVDIVSNMDATGGADVVVAVNPNNPDGRLIEARSLAEQARSLSQRGGLLIIDESFADVSPAEASFAPRVADHRAIVLRSFGKFFGLGGLRLGFAIAAPALAARLRDALGPWAVSGPAVVIGAGALGDAAWQDDARRRLASDAERIDAVLQQNGLRIVGGTSLFRLATCSDAHALNNWLSKHGILARVFSHDPRWIRFGIPADEDWDRLGEALATWRGDNARTLAK